MSLYLFLAALCARGALAGDLVLDSVAEFSGEQGRCGWFYAYFEAQPDTPFDASQLKPLPNFDGHWYLQEGVGGYWTRLTRSGGHPNGRKTSLERQGVDHWVVRRWISPLVGKMELTGSVYKVNPTGGNGVVAMIFVDGVEQYRVQLEAEDVKVYHYSLQLMLQQGSAIDFAVDPLGSNDLKDEFVFVAEGRLPGAELPDSVLYAQDPEGCMLER